MDNDQRIAQFEALCRDDAENDMAHFSLAGAYMAAERFSDAAGSYLRCVEINSTMSKAYQLAGEALERAGERDRAVEVLTKGHAVAGEQGDLMPQRAMEKLLSELGAPIPIDTSVTVDGEGDFVCSRSGRPGTRLDRAPFRNGMGVWIQEKISRQTFDEWIGMGTKIINELRLDLSRDEHDAVYDYAMRRYIGLDDETYRSVMDGAEPPQPAPDYRDAIDQIIGRAGELEDFKGEMHRGVSGS